MFRNHVSINVARVGGFVNVAVTIAALALIGAGYFSALGRIAGVV